MASDATFDTAAASGEATAPLDRREFRDALGWFATGHVKHGLAFLGVAVLCLVGAWFTSNPSGTKS